MDVAIKPFWIALSVVYFWLAAKHYYRQFLITPSIYIAAANSPAPDNNPYVPAIFKKFIHDIEESRQLMWLATVGFFVGGVVFLLQGITDLEYQIPVNVALVIVAAVIVLLFVYWRWRWVFVPITGPVSRWWWRRRVKLLEKKGSA